MDVDVKCQAEGKRVALDNGVVRWAAEPGADGQYRQRLSAYAERGLVDLFTGDGLLGVTVDGELVNLPCTAVTPVTCSKGTGLSLSGEEGIWRYNLALELEPGARWLEGTLRFQTSRPVRGWFHYRLAAGSAARCWIYPWLNAGRDHTPTLGGHSLGMDCPGHIHACLAGVPLLIVRDGALIGGVGFALVHDYHHDSLAYERRDGEQLLGVGKGLNSGAGAFHGRAQYRPGAVYEIKFQLFALAGGFRELAQAWAAANDFSFDRKRYYSIDQALEIVAAGRAQEVCNGTVRYVRQDVNGLPVRGYRHSSGRQNRISVYRQAMNAYVDYLLYQRTGKAVFRERVVEQMDFLLAAQTPAGWFQEDWHVVPGDWGYEVIREDGGIAQIIDSNGSVTAWIPPDTVGASRVDSGIAQPLRRGAKVDPRTGHNIRGPRPDYLGMTVLYMHKLQRALEQHEGLRRDDWAAAMQRCLDWLLRMQWPDGAWAMTVSPDEAVQTDAAPMGRLLVALDVLAAELGDARLEAARARHEQWILEHCVEPQQCWGSHKDTGLMIDYGGLQSFIQYCVQRYERTEEQRYLELARECTYFNFFEHCPKQLEWLWHYSKGGIMEQGNYMQYDIDNMDNLPCVSWYKLARYTNDEFLLGFTDQAVYTTMHTLCDDPKNPWYGAWPQYLVDPANSAQHYDESPVDKGASKYAGSIVATVVEDLLLLQQAGYRLPGDEPRRR